MSEAKHDARLVLIALADAAHDDGITWISQENIAKKARVTEQTVRRVLRELEKDGVPVLLTVQVDSVEQRHQNDEVIPANVAKAMNFYQLNGLLHGRETFGSPRVSRAGEAFGV